MFNVLTFVVVSAVSRILPAQDAGIRADARPLSASQSKAEPAPPDSRLTLPVPVYRLRDETGGSRLLLRKHVEASNAWHQVEAIPFLAMPPHTNDTEMVPFYAVSVKGADILCRYPPAQLTGKIAPLFFAWPADYHVPSNHLDGRWNCLGWRPAGSQVSFFMDLQLNGNAVTGLFDQTTFWQLVKIRSGSLVTSNLTMEVEGENNRYVLTGTLLSNNVAGTYRAVEGEEQGRWEGRRIRLLPPEAATPALVPLFEYRQEPEGQPVYSTDPGLETPTFKRSEHPVCLVWRTPSHVRPPARDPTPAHPAPD